MMESDKSSFLHDIEERRRRARQHLAKGAVTDDYGADRETVLRLLDEALATEIVCMLRYRRHYHMARGIYARPIAAEFLEHARDEERHAEQIAERIVQLGGEPDYNPDGILARSHCEYVEGGSLVQMIRENLVAERIAIDAYASIVRYVSAKDPTTRRLLEEILAKEEEHANDLADFLVDLETERSEHGDEHKAGQSGKPASGEQPKPLRVLGHETGPLPRDLGYGPSHGYDHGHGGPSGPGDAPAASEPAEPPV